MLPEGAWRRRWHWSAPGHSWPSCRCPEFPRQAGVTLGPGSPQAGRPVWQTPFLGAGLGQVPPGLPSQTRRRASRLWPVPVLDTVSHSSCRLQTPHHSFPCPWGSPGKNTGVDCHFLLQGMFLNQGLNPCLLCQLHWQIDSSPGVTWEVPYFRPFLSIYLMFGCAAPSLLCLCFLQLWCTGLSLWWLLWLHTMGSRHLGSQAWLPRGTWNLPGPGLKPVSPALAGRLLSHCTTREIF